MAEKPTSAQQRAARLARELRENLKRRKAQARGREQTAPSRGAAAANPKS